MPYWRRTIERCALILSSVLLGCSCTPSYVGYGVFLWSAPEYPFVTGEVVEILDESRIDETYLVTLGGEEEAVLVPTWRVRHFSKPDRARTFTLEYGAYYTIYAFSQRDGLPVRDKPSQEARILYKLQKGQLLKVLRRSEQPETVGAYRDHWYEVLTEDGYQGFCFGYLLTSFSTESDPGEEIARLLEHDPFLDMFLITEWRPEYYWEMITSQKIDLSRFSDEIGLFPEPENGIVRIVTAHYASIFEYERIERVGTDRYVFADSGLRMRALSQNRISVSHQIAGQNVSSVFVQVRESIPKIIQGELERRELVYESFLLRGNMLRSEAYGDIVLDEDLHFFWRGFEKMPAGVFPTDVNGKGTIEFALFLSEDLESDYGGVISFVFDEHPAGPATNFIYTFTGDGVRFIFVRKENIERHEVQDSGSSPLVIYFRFLSLVEPDEQSE